MATGSSAPPNAIAAMVLPAIFAIMSRRPAGPPAFRPDPISICPNSSLSLRKMRAMAMAASPHFTSRPVPWQNDSNLMYFGPSPMILRQAGLLIASLALIAASVSGCSQMPGGMFGGPSNLAVEPGDPCGAQRAAFADSQSYFTREIAVRALTGAVVGAGGGAAIGSLANGSNGALTGMIAGALTGAALGAMSGYFDQLQQQHLDQAQ